MEWIIIAITLGLAALAVFTVGIIIAYTLED